MLVLSDITSEKEKENELVIAERMLESALSHIDGGFLEWDVLNNRLYMSTDGELKSIGISADKEKGNMRIIENFPDCIFDAIPVNCQERIRANLRKDVYKRQAVFSMTNLIDMKMVKSLLLASGYTDSQANVLYGQLSGKYVTLTTLPVSISSAMATAAIPTIAASITAGDVKMVKSKINVALKLAMVISIPVSYTHLSFIVIGNSSRRSSISGFR